MTEATFHQDSQIDGDRESTREKRLIPKRVVRRKFGDPSNTTYWRWQRSGVIPAPIKLSSGMCLWLEEEVDAAIDALAASRFPGRQEAA